VDLVASLILKNFQPNQIWF